MGVTVIRLYTLPMGSALRQYAYVTDSRSYNEDNLKRLDKFLQLAANHDVRVIIPFIDAWSFVGGITEFAAFRGKAAGLFFSDSQLKQDFRNLMYDIVNRVNTYTGVQYKDDKTIAAWQSGNELDGNASWTATWEIEMADYIKTVDANHLFMSGAHALFTPSTALLNSANVDILGVHPYSFFSRPLNPWVDSYISGTVGKKPFIADEYGDSSPTNITTMLAKISPNANFAGAIAWSLRGRSSAGGFYKHYEGFSPPFWSLNWPGSSLGESVFYEQTQVSDLRLYAYQVRGLTAPARPAPGAPYMSQAARKGAVRFMGGAGAATHQIERAVNPEGPWTTLATNNSDYGQSYNYDVITPYLPLNDTGAPTGTVYYRARGTNAGGLSGPYSNVAQVTDSGLIDDNDASLIFTGTWTHGSDANYYNGTKSYSATTGSTATLDFSGARVGLYAKTASWLGKFDVYLDGTYTATVDTYAPTERNQTLVYNKEGLTNGPHTITVLLNGQKNANSSAYTIGLDAFDIANRYATTDDGDSPVNYAGTWTHSADANYFNGTKSVSLTTGSAAGMSFQGTEISIFAKKDPWLGEFDVYIDGAYDATVDTYSSVISYKTNVYSKVGLSGGWHRIQVVLNGQKNPSSGGYTVGLDYFGYR